MGKEGICPPGKVVKKRVLLNSYFEGERGDARCVPRFGIPKPMLIIVPKLYLIHRRLGAKIVAASGHLEVKNCTKIYLHHGSAPDPAGGA